MKRFGDSLYMVENEILIYQTEDGQTKIDVKFQDETVWLTQAQLCELYKPVNLISVSILNISLKKAS